MRRRRIRDMGFVFHENCLSNCLTEVDHLDEMGVNVFFFSFLFFFVSQQADKLALPILKGQKKRSTFDCDISLSLCPFGPLRWLSLMESQPIKNCEHFAIRLNGSHMPILFKSIFFIQFTGL